MWQSSSQASRWAWLLLLALGLSLASTGAQTTTSGQQQPDMKPKSVTVSVEDLLTLRSKIADLERNSRTLSEQAASFQEQLIDSETIQQTLADSLMESLNAQESLSRASKARAALDRKAIDEARAQGMAWAGGGFLVGAALTVVTVFVFR